MFFIVLINVKSGGNVGPKLLVKFKEAFKQNEFEGIVVSLMDCDQYGKCIGPGPILRMYKERYSLRIIGCGGDGTITWILSEVDKIYWGRRGKPLIGIVPLGTGNDLSRCLKWGKKYEERPIQNILAEMREANPTPLDRWKISWTSENWGANCKDPNATDELPKNMRTMTNYFSVGVDANIALQFHKAREAHPKFYSNIVLNKLGYMKEGICEIYQRQFSRLMDYVDCVVITKDNIKQEISGKDTKIHSILLLNINSYGGGKQPWAGSEASINDGLIEVISFKTRDLACLQLGCKGSPLAQAKEVIINIKKALPIQVDGEAILLNPGKLTVSYLYQVNMLVNEKEDEVNRGKEATTEATKKDEKCCQCCTIL